MTSMGYIERICKERAEVASSDHLEGEAHSHVVAATFGDQAFVSVVEEEEPLQFQTCRRPRVAAVPKRHSLGVREGLGGDEDNAGPRNMDDAPVGAEASDQMRSDRSPLGRGLDAGFRSTVPHGPGRWGTLVLA